MNTLLSYFEDTYKFNERAVVTECKKDEKGFFLTLNQTIFYPQGGGQPSDRGEIKVGGITAPVHMVKLIENEVRHYVDQNYKDIVGKEAVCTIDQELRLLHAKLHTAGHLISNIIDTLYPEWHTVKGHHFPGECYVEFNSKFGTLDKISVEEINAKIGHLIEENCSVMVDKVSPNKLQELCPNLSYRLPSDQPIRIVRIRDFPYSPCGGTHIKSLKELEGLKIIKYKINHKIMKMNYEIE